MHRRLVSPRAALALSALIATAAPVCLLAQPLHRVIDLETAPDLAGPEARGFADAGGVYYFAADDGLHGREPWRTDGTPGGTFLVADLCPGRCGSAPADFTALGDDVFFTASDGVTGRELWRTDGTDGGSVLVREVCPGPCDGVSDELIVFDGKLFFTAWDGGPAAGLWSSDGTAGGTRPVAEGFSGPGRPKKFVEFHDRLLFAADDGTTGSELWSSDGTEAGTRLVKDICAGCDGLLFGSGFESVPPHLFFVAVESVHGEELWRTDGTEEGTTLVADLNPGPGGTLLSQLVAFGDRLYVVGSGCPSPPCAWRTDGTAAGTVPATELFPLGTQDFQPLLAAAGPRLFFTVSPGGSSPDELWVLSGDPPVAQRVMEGLPFRGLEPYGERVLFWNGSPDGASWRLWVSDGTPAGTAPLTPPTPEPSEIAAFSQHAFFHFAGDGEMGADPWVTDGTPAGNRPLGEIRRPSSHPANVWPLVEFDDQLYFDFSFVLGGGDYGLWRSDGSEAGTFLAIQAAGVDSQVVRYRDRLLFAGQVGPPESFETGVYATDGTQAGTVLLAETFGRELTPVGDVVFFRSSFPGQRFWVSDGTPGGTRQIADVKPDHPGVCGGDPPSHIRCPPAFPRSLTAVGDTVFFAAYEEDAHAQLWKSDGTPEGTVAVRPFAVGERQAPWEPPRDLVAFSGGLLFSAYEEASGRELWRSDGSPAGTRRIADLAAGPASSDPREIAVAGTAAYFLAGDSEAGERLWRVAPGSLALSVVHDFAADPGAFVVEMTAVGDRLFLVVFSPTTGTELWTSDGTPAGTGLLRDLFPGSRGSSPRAVTAVDGRLVFSADDGEHGVELWVSDGTPAGTRLVADVYPGPAPSDPDRLQAAGPWLYFVADDGEAGRELWVADRAALAAGAEVCVAGPTALCLNGGRFRVQVDWRTQLGTAGPGRVVPVGSDDSGLFWFFHPDNWELLVKVLDGCPLDDHYWVFFAATTNVEFTLTVTDTASGGEKTYRNGQGHPADAVTDTAAFATCP